jgi:uncharacterized protein
LCPECGVLLATEPGHHHDRVDPRWAKLADVLDAEVLNEAPDDASRGEQ